MSDKILIRVAQEWTREDLQDHIVGSGASAFPWYHEGIGVERDGSFVFDLEDPDDETKTIHKVVTEAEMVKAIEDLSLENEFVRRQVAGQDIDADGADCIIQYAVYGKVIFG